jgi:demethylmenaquinone methyltransferase/2-methoxy-6-polyprenyl-1,4-benzoquinol methylase
MSDAVRAMFATIARRYDRANAILSLGVHSLWRRRALALLAPRPGERILDACCGTGDLARAAARAVEPRGRVVGVDFCAPMLEVARARAGGLAALELVLADALALPFPDAAFDGATMAFGARNLDDPVGGLRELARVVRPGGRVVVLEFGQPAAPLFGRIYGWYARAVIPALGAAVTGERAPYEYLPRTAAAFPAGARFEALMARAGLLAPRATPLALGIAYVYRGEVPAARGGAHAARP